MSSAVDVPALGRASDAQLTSLVRQGSAEAFRALYARHRGTVDAIARASSRDRAEDIAQEAWTSAYRALSGPGEPIEHAGPWLATIARNVARDRARRDGRRPEIASDDVVAAMPAAGGVESALEGKQEIGRLLGAFDELPEDQQLILQLREFGDLTYKEIAELLGKPESTIEAALFRARRKVAKEYAELDSGRRCRIVQSQILAGRELTHRERRRLTRHLGRCASCERVARLEGAVDLIPERRLARIAGVIPVPAGLARLTSGAAETAGPLAGKAAVAAVAVVAGVGAFVVTGGGDPPAGPAPAPAVAAEAAPPGMTLVSAPNVVRTTRITAPERRASAGGGSVTPAAARPASSPAAAPAVTSEPRRAEPRRAATRQRRAATPPPAPQTSAPAPAAPAPAAPQPAAPTPAPAAPQPVQQAAPPAPAPAPSASTGPSVTQTPTCLTDDCTIAP